MNDSFTGMLPWLLWGGRIALSAVAVLLLIRCGRALLSGGKRESWGFLSLSNGARYPLYHWENMIGRARQADIRINFPSVSRSHAALCQCGIAQLQFTLAYNKHPEAFGQAKSGIKSAYTCTCDNYVIIIGKFHDLHLVFKRKRYSFQYGKSCNTEHRSFIDDRYKTTAAYNC